MVAALAAIVVVGCSPGFDGSDPGEWSNRTSGDGWRLLANGRVDADEAYLVRAATDEAGYAGIWRELTLAGSAPPADLSEEVVVSFAQGIGSSCPELRLDDVMIDDGEVSAAMSDPIVDEFGSPRACTADLVGAVVFVVALQRDAVPADGFVLWLSEAAKPYTEPIEVELEP